MKKLFILSVLFLSFSVLVEEVQADEYTTYQEITFEHQGASLLSEFAQSDYDKYYPKISKKRFWGWRTYLVYEDEEVEFIRETLYVIKNGGDTAIEESIKLHSDASVKRHYSVTGNLELTGGGTVEGFKLGLEQALGTEVSKTITTNLEETYSIKVLVDPNTKVIIQIKGEGYVTNGVGKYYRFWTEVRKGGWEIFTVTTEYYSLEKVRLDED
jgi:uncharacterized protein YxjI